MWKRLKIPSLKIISAAVLGYFAHFPARFLEDILMGWLQDWLAERQEFLYPLTQQTITILIEWIVPIVGAIVIVWLVFYLGTRHRSGASERSFVPIIGTIEAGSPGDDMTRSRLQPTVPPLELMIRTRTVGFGDSGTGVRPHTEDGNPVLMVGIETDLEAMASMHVESLALKILGESIPCADWHPLDVGTGFDVARLQWFALPSRVVAGTYTVSLEAWANGRLWGSHPFNIDVPSR